MRGDGCPGARVQRGLDVCNLPRVVAGPDGGCTVPTYRVANVGGSVALSAAVSELGDRHAVAPARTGEKSALHRTGLRRGRPSPHRFRSGHLRVSSGATLRRNDAVAVSPLRERENRDQARPAGRAASSRLSGRRVGPIAARDLDHSGIAHPAVGRRAGPPSRQSLHEWLTRRRLNAST